MVNGNIFVGYWLIMVSIFGTLGNLLVIVAVIRNKKLQVLCNYFVVSLSVADGILCGIVLPLHSQGIIMGRWVLGDYMCRIQAIGSLVVLGTSVVTLGSIALNRFFTIVCYTRKALSSRTAVIVMLVASYIYPWFPLLPAITGQTGRQEYSNVTRRCGMVSTGINLTTIFIASIVMIPTLFMTFSYIGIFYTIRKTNRRMRQHNQGGSNDGKKMQGEFKLAKTMGMVYLSFVICLIPSTLVNFLDIPSENPIDGFLVSLVWFSSCLNPVIYGLSHRNFKQAYIEIFCATGFCRKPRIEPDSDIGATSSAGRATSKT